MDDTLKVSFPAGKFEVTVIEPTDGQRFALALSQNPNNRDGMIRLVRRVARVMESLMGPAQWDEVIENGLIHGDLEVGDLMQLVQDVLSFDWSAYAKNAVAEPEDATEPAAVKRPAPRVVSGG
jgi:hypothetical protein